MIRRVVSYFAPPGRKTGPGFLNLHYWSIYFIKTKLYMHTKIWWSYVHIRYLVYVQKWTYLALGWPYGWALNFKIIIRGICFRVKLDTVRRQYQRARRKTCSVAWYILYSHKIITIKIIIIQIYFNTIWINKRHVTEKVEHWNDHVIIYNFFYDDFINAILCILMTQNWSVSWNDCWLTQIYWLDV